MRAKMKNIRVFALTLVLPALIAFAFLMQTPSHVVSLDMTLAMSEKITAEGSPHVDTCHMISTCDVPPIIGNNVQASNIALIGKSTFEHVEERKSSITPEAHIPPPRG